MLDVSCLTFCDGFSFRNNVEENAISPAAHSTQIFESLRSNVQVQIVIVNNEVCNLRFTYPNSSRFGYKKLQNYSFFTIIVVVYIIFTQPLLSTGNIFFLKYNESLNFLPTSTCS